MELTENTIVLRAVEAFRDNTGFDTEYQPNGTDGPTNPDGIVRIRHGDHQLQFAAQIKRGINRTTVGLVRQQMRKPGQHLLITDYVNPELATTLKEQGIPFMDAAGNTFIKAHPLYVFIRGNKPADEFKADRTKRLFKPSGLRVLFALLNQPGAEKNPYRDIATDAGVALGTVGWVIRDLKDTGFMVDLGKMGRRVLNRNDLLRRWVEAYPEQLRLKLAQGTFMVDDQAWWKGIIPHEFGAYWGGEIAAAELTGYLKPEKFVIYTDVLQAKLVFKCKMHKDPHGNLDVLKRFWNFPWEAAERGIVPPLLVYADLMATGDARNIEAAEMIYDKHLTRLVREY